MASGSEDSSSDIDGEILTDDEEVSSDDDDLQFPEGGRGPWIPVFDQQNYVRDHINDFITDGPVGPINRNLINPQPIDYFENQLSNGETSLFELLTNETNRYAAQFFQQHPVQDLPPNSRSRQWIDVTLAEMRTFIGLLLLMGIIQKPSIESYWSTNCLLSTPSFANAMSRNRFQLILKFLHANDNEQNPARDHPDYDPAGKLTEMVNLCNQGFSRNYRLARDITVDERMVGFKGRHHMVQYMANKKAHRWGIKLWTLSESDTGYTHQIVVYKGRQALSGRQSSDTCKHSASVRRFSGYGLLNTTVQEVEGFKGAVWYRYTCPYQQDLQMNIRHLPGTINADTLLGFNNTGNVCVWPSEEIMAYYCVKNIEQFKNCHVCELGGGMTCLAGIAMCMLSEANNILVTDGNEDSVSNLSKIIENKENKVSFKVEDCDTRVLRWGDGELEQDLTNKYDFVLCADCLFFEEGREDLIKKVFNLLKDTGTSLMFAPKRGTTFDEFVSLAKSVFNVEVIENYDDTIWDLHCKLKADANGLYDENIHYPLYMKLTKKLT